MSTVAERTRREREAQGFPARIVDPDVLDAVVLALVDHRRDDAPAGKRGRPVAREGGGNRAST
jgi:hypothetical protein